VRRLLERQISRAAAYVDRILKGTKPAGAIRDAVRSLDLAVRCGLHTGECEDRGTHALKGVPNEWRLFRANLN
jgi:hypothetical protein